MNKNQTQLIQCPYCPAFGELRGWPIHLKLAHNNKPGKVLYPDAQRELHKLLEEI